MIGWHVDTFYKFRKQLREFDETRFEIVRYMNVPLSSSRGQAFCVEGEWVTDWRAGDGITWHPSSGHCGVNAGTEVTATINCTGLIEKEKFQEIFLIWRYLVRGIELTVSDHVDGQAPMQPIVW